MENLDRIQTLEGILSRQLDWIRATDTRGGFIIAMSTAMLGVLATQVPPASESLTVGCWLAIIPAAALEVLALLFVWRAAFPETGGPKHSIIYFGGIDTHTRSQYVLAAKGLTEEAYLDDLAQQCHRNGQIATNKYKLIKWAMKSLYASVPVWVIAVFLLYNSQAPVGP